MTRSMLFLFVSLLLAASLLTACGPAAVPNSNPDAPLPTAIPQSTESSSIPITANNCTLLSKNDVGQILTEEVLDARDPASDGTICVYQTANMILEVNFLHKFGGLGDSVNYMSTIRTSDETTVAVPGLGDEAFYHGASAYRLLLVRVVDTVYTFGVRSVTADGSISSPENAQVLEKTLAEKLLSIVQ